MKMLLRSTALALCLCQFALAPVSAQAGFTPLSPSPSVPIQAAAPVVFGADEHPFPTVNLDRVNPSEGQLYTESHPDAPMTGVAFSIPAGLIQQNSNGGGTASLLAELILTTPVRLDATKLPLYEAINERGGSVSYVVDNSTVTFNLEMRSPRVAELLGLFATALAKPSFDRDHLSTARHQLLEILNAQAADPATVGMRTFRSAFYRDSFQRMPSSGTRAEMLAIRLAQLRELYARAYRRTGAVAAVVGVISPGVVSAARSMLDTLPTGEVKTQPLAAWAPFPPNSSVIATAHIPQPVFVLGFKAPAVTSPDFGAMFILATLFQVSLGRDATTTALQDAYRPYHVSYDFISTPANMTVTVTSAGEAYLTAARTVSVWIEALSSRLLDAPTMTSIKTLTEGRYLTQTLEPTQEAGRIVVLANLGLGPDGANELLHRIASVTPADLQRVTRQYCANPIYARVAPLNEPTP